MKDKVILVEMLFDKVEQYCNTTVELYKLKAIEKSADVFSSLTSRIIVLIIITLFFLFFTIGIALYIGELLGKSYYGFFAVSAFYAVLAIIFFIMRKPFLESIFNDYIIRQIFKEKENAGNKR